MRLYFFISVLLVYVVTRKW